MDTEKSAIFTGVMKRIFILLTVLQGFYFFSTENKAQFVPYISVPTTIYVPGTYPTLTGTGGAFEMINQGVLTGNTTIYITADIIEPGTVGLNAWTENPPGSNYRMAIRPADSINMRTISSTAAITGLNGLIRATGASRFTIDGGPSRKLKFRLYTTDYSYLPSAPTIQFTNGALNDTLKNCIVESSSGYWTWGTVNIGPGTNTVVISSCDIRNSTVGINSLQETGIASSSGSNSVRVLNNNIYNYQQMGFYAQLGGGVADGAVISGNSFYNNSTVSANYGQYGVYMIVPSSGHTISGNYIGGQAPHCGGAPWNKSSADFYGIYGVVGSASPTTISNNTIQNIFLSNSGNSPMYTIYEWNGSWVNIVNNLLGSMTVTNSITSAGTGNFYGIYAELSATHASNIQGNIISGLNFTNSTGGNVFLLDEPGGLVNIGTTTGNYIGSPLISNSITYAGTGNVYGIYLTSDIAGNDIENNYFGSWNLTSASGSPHVYGLYITSANVKKNRVFSIGTSGSNAKPIIYGIFNNNPITPGITNEYSNNLVSLDGGASLNPTIYGYYDNCLNADVINLYYNDIYITGPATTTSSTCALYRSSSPAYSLYNIYNNNFINKRMAGGSGKHYGVYVYNTGTCNSDHNNIYSPAGPFGFYNGSNVMTFSDWKTVTGTETYSKNVDPWFISTSDLHTTRLDLNNTGVTIPAVTTDYASVIRGNPPDIGSYEFSLIPVVTTLAATGITNTGATLNGSVNAKNESVITSFDYGLTTAYGNYISATPPVISDSITVNMNAILSGLLSNTLYHYRAKGVCNGITYTGADMSFTTGGCPAAGPAGPISGPVQVCQGGSGYIYSVAGIPNATGYSWILPTGGTIISGNNTSTITVSFDYTASSGLVTVYGTSSCGNGSPSQQYVTVNPAASPTITGSNSLCVNSGFYNYTTEAGMSNYTWTVSPGGTITYGQGTNVAQVTWNSPGAQWITVSYLTSSGCSSPSPATLNVSVDPLPGAAGIISGPSQLCAGSAGIIYTVDPIPNITVYVWTLPPGAIIVSGAGTNTITVDFDPDAVSGYIKVYGNNICGNGSVSPSFFVAVYPVPMPPVITLIGDTLLHSNMPVGNQWYYEGVLIPGATEQNYRVIQFGIYWDIVTLYSCSSDTSNHIDVVVGISEHANETVLSVFPNPNNGEFNIELLTTEPGEFDLYVINNLGIKIREYRELQVGGTLQKRIILPNEPDGIYSLILQGDGHRFVRKIMVSR